jgi:hypothetical protein
MARLARFDPKMPGCPVLGWYDTELGDKPDADAHTAPVPDDIWDARTLGAWFAVQDGQVVKSDGPAGQKASSLPRVFPKAVLLNRIIEAKKLRAFRAVLGLDESGAELDDARLELRERWSANDLFQHNDAALRQALAAAGCEPDQILRR